MSNFGRNPHTPCFSGMSNNQENTKTELTNFFVYDFFKHTALFDNILSIYIANALHSEESFCLINTYIRLCTNNKFCLYLQKKM